MEYKLFFFSKYNSRSFFYNTLVHFNMYSFNCTEIINFSPRALQHVFSYCSKSVCYSCLQICNIWKSCRKHFVLNPLTPNDPYSGRTAPLTSKRCILYIYSTNTGTEYFKRSIYSPFFSLQKAVCFIILTYLVPVLFTFYIQGVLKFKKIIPAPKALYPHKRSQGG